MADFRDHFEDLDQCDIKVVALSADGLEDAANTKKERGLPFPIGWGLDPFEVRERIGGYIQEEKGYLQPTGFVLNGGKISQVTYSSGALGRLQAENVAAMVQHAQKQG